MDLGDRIGRGQTAELYALDSAHVAKLFKEGVSGDVAVREATNTSGAVEAGLPAPAVFGVDTVNKRPVIVYERIRGETMRSRIQSAPWTLLQNARRFAQLHREIHSARAAGLRSVREELRRKISAAPGLDPDARARVLAQLDSLPEGAVFCHGDFHPENVLLADEPVIIDWLDAGRGHPAADVARTNLLLRFAGGRERGVHAALREIFRRRYLHAYCRRSRVSRDQVRAWELPVAVARLTEDVPEEERLRSFIDSRLQLE